MRWPKFGRRESTAAVIGGDEDTLWWMRGGAALGQAAPLGGAGRLDRNGSNGAEFARRLRALGLPAEATVALLPLEGSQLLQINAPGVPPAEMKAAARWHVKDLVSERVEDLTLDVMPVGDGRPHGPSQLFVAAARSALIRERVELAQAAGLQLRVIDIVESAQRNLQSALAARDGFEARATAALTKQGDHALLTICAAGELFYARRIEGAGAMPSSGHAEGADAHGASPGSRPGVPSRPGGRAGTGMPSASKLEGLPAFVDYGAEMPAATTDFYESSPLLVELQRSFDVWERTWRDLPLARLYVEFGDDDPRWTSQLGDVLSLQVDRLDPEPLLPGFAAAVVEPGARLALLPLAGALLRREHRTL